jgi:hypothetical protein
MKKHLKRVQIKVIDFFSCFVYFLSIFLFVHPLNPPPAGENQNRPLSPVGRATPHKTLSAPLP